ncbi:NmrA family NAD(P)-binding protein [Cryptosporangium arvum]|uniref:Putative nucleoside-diphosphate sugar epimerase n=1 Tax=Cryptosporangium arvum DSM 44712 TaxID=927661 RepID=A0A011ACN6_9ACTN|nr:NAD(P)H-binding protein [Cryptosporangium arvum]EXG79791.1 putative nucleoside-diphosphate sugar epimerase [Cryptosporangium arvum DSM 44712]
MTRDIAVTGATGQVGRRVAARLAAADVPHRLLVRGSATALDGPAATVSIGAGYADAPAVRSALDGVGTLFLVSGRESADRVAEHRTIIDAAVRAGVERVVYLSFLGAAPDCTFTFGRDHWHTEQYLRGTGLGFTFLRDSFYTSMLPALVGPDGVLRGPGGTGRVSAVAPTDVADAAAAALVAAAPDQQTYELTGPVAISLDEAAEELGRRVGRPIRYQAETVEEAYASRAGYGAPDFEVAGWVTSYVAIADGSLSRVGDGVERLTGHPPLTFAHYLDANPESYAHLR